jgi:hypothetical protein
MFPTAVTQHFTDPKIRYSIDLLAQRGASGLRLFSERRIVVRFSRLDTHRCNANDQLF